MRRLAFEPFRSAIIALGVGALVAVVANTSARAGNAADSRAGNAADSNGTAGAAAKLNAQISGHGDPNRIKNPDYAFIQLRLRPDGRAEIYGRGLLGAAIVVTVADRVLGQSAVDSQGKWHISTSAANPIGRTGHDYNLQLLAFEPRADDLHVVDELQIRLPLIPSSAVALGSAQMTRARRQGMATPAAQGKALQTVVQGPYAILERSSSMIVTASSTSKDAQFMKLAQIGAGSDGDIGSTVRGWLERVQSGYRSVIEKLADKPAGGDKAGQGTARTVAEGAQDDGKVAEGKVADDARSGARRTLPAGEIPSARLAGELAPITPPSELLAQTSGGGPLDIAREWYDRSDKSFRDVMRKLSVDGENLRRARKRAKDRDVAASRQSPGEGSPRRRKDDEGTNQSSGLVRLLQSVLPMEWWSRSRKEYKETVGKLARKPKDGAGEPMTAKAPDIGPRELEPGQADTADDAARMAAAKARRDNARAQEAERAKEARARERADAEAALQRKQNRERDVADARLQRERQTAEQKRLAQEAREALEAKRLAELAVQKQQQAEAERRRLADEQKQFEAQARAKAEAEERKADLAKTQRQEKARQQETARREAKATADKNAAEARARADAAARRQIEEAKARAEFEAQQARQRAQALAKRQQQEQRARAELNRRVAEQKRKYAAQQRRLAQKKALEEQRLAQARAEEKARAEAKAMADAKAAMAAETARAEKAEKAAKLAAAKAKIAAAKIAKAKQRAQARARADQRREEQKVARAARAASAAAAQAEKRARKAAVEVARAEKQRQDQQRKTDAARRAAADAVQKNERQRTQRRLREETRRAELQKRKTQARRRDLARSESAARNSREKSRQADSAAKAAGDARRASQAAKSDEARREADRKFSFSIREAKEAAADAIEAARAKIAARKQREKRIAQGLPPRQIEQGSTPGDDLQDGTNDRRKAGKKKIAQQSRSRSRGGEGECEEAGVRIDLPGWYVVRRGDTLRTIAKRHYRSSRARRLIHRANHGRIDDLNNLNPCTRLRLPLPEPAG